MAIKKGKKLPSAEQLLSSYTPGDTIVGVKAGVPIKSMWPCEGGTIGVDLGHDHSMTVGSLVKVNGQDFVVFKVISDTILLAPTKIHGYPEHNPLEKPAIKKDWVQGIVSVQQKQGTQKSDIDFLQDMFADTPVDESMVKFLDLSSDGPNVPVKHDLDEFVEVPEPEDLDTEKKEPEPYPDIPLDPGMPIKFAVDEATGKIYPGGGELKGDGNQPSVGKKPHLMVKIPSHIKDVKISLGKSGGGGGGVAHKVIYDITEKIASDIDKALLDSVPYPQEKVSFRVKSCPPKGVKLAQELIMAVAHCSPSLAVAALTSKAWVEVDLGVMTQLAEQFSVAEDYGIVFEVKDA